jgi:hypothetical protein
MEDADLTNDYLLSDKMKINLHMLGSGGQIWCHPAAGKKDNSYFLLVEYRFLLHLL